MSSRARKRHQRSNGSPLKKILLGFGVVLVVIGIAAGAAAGWVYDMWNDAGSIDDQKLVGEEGANSKVYAADGSLLGIIDANIIREPVGLKAIPKSLQSATIAIEDENFYEHDGVDFSAIVRATVENVEAGEIEQGASTITQQLVRNLYIKKPDDTLERKLTEAKWSMEFEEDYTKDEILEKYLNTATYGTNSGDTAVGVEAAAQIYFNKSVEQINIGEAALLAGLPQAPSQYNPFTSADAALKRRNLVLDAMLDQGYISDAEHQKWSSAGLGLERGLRYDQFRYRYFFDYVQQELIDRYGTNTARVGGLNVYTTLEPRLQDLAESSIEANYVPPGAAAALVSTDTETGEIKAMASSSNYDDSEFNLAAQGKRQPGSSYKPFALAAAVEQGMDPDTTTYAAPGTITINPCTGCPPWTVSGGGSGSMTLRNATANSINTVFAQLVVDVTPEAMNDVAHRMGITSPTGDFVSEVLGTADVSVLEMSNAYATFANGGVHHDPTAIARVEFPNGDVDELDPSTGKRAFSDGVAYEVADVMKGALEYGTAAGRGIGCPASGKTGTTEQQSDVWFVGYTPHVSTAVWRGNPDIRTPMPGYGADLAAPIWQDYMLEAATEPCDDFPEPKDPVSLTSGSSGYASSDDSDGPTDSNDYDEPADDGIEDTDNDGADDDLYAPGVEGDTADRGNGDNGNGSPGPAGNPGNQGGGGGPDHGGVSP